MIPAVWLSLMSGIEDSTTDEAVEVGNSRVRQSPLQYILRYDSVDPDRRTRKRARPGSLFT
jgi:hypothetical protein